jgi:protein-tyrosine-phosphatase
MGTSRHGSKPRAVLFACGLNALRSPMAAGLFAHFLGPDVHVGSAGVRKGELDPFAVAVLREVGIDIAEHRPLTFEELDEWEGLDCDLIVTLSPEAHHKALEMARSRQVEVEYWPMPDPTAVEGSREQRLDAYRDLRQQLVQRIKARFISQAGGSE